MKNNNLHQTLSNTNNFSCFNCRCNVGIWKCNYKSLLEGFNEIFLVTARVLIIGTLLFSYYIIFNKDKFENNFLKKLHLLDGLNIFVSWAFIFALQYIIWSCHFINAQHQFLRQCIAYFKKEKISKLKYLSVVVGFSGIAYLFISQKLVFNQGNIFLGGSLAFLVQCIAVAQS